MDVTNYVLSHRERALLIGDHGTYRAQLSRQLKTLRKQLGRATPKNAQYAHKPITAEDVAGNPQYESLLSW
jgi:signal recognition particle subunit SRP68